MSANTYTTSDLISLIKILGHVPQSNSTFTNANLLTLADFELETSVAAMLKKANEGYFQDYVERAQNASGQYRIPSAAIAAGTYSIQVRNGQAIWPVSRQDVSEMTTTSFPSVGNFACFIRSNTINMLPAQFGGVLRITFERRPSKLVAVTACAQVTAINGQVVTVSSVPSTFAVGTEVEIQQDQPQFDVLDTCAITDITGTDITLDGDLTDLVVGNFICLEGQTCIPQVPVEFHKLLAQRVVVKIYEIQGYSDKMKAAQAKLSEMEAALIGMITPRTESEPKVINPSWGGRKPGTALGRFNPPAGPNS